MATIRQGKHYDSNLFSSLPFVCLDEMSREVTFTDSCRYTLPEYNQQDINKLFGMAFGFDHHKESARFGWAYNPKTDRIDIVAYCYVGGQRLIGKLISVEIGKKYTFGIKVLKNSYVFWEETEGVIGVEAHKSLSFFGYTLGLYFGGALPAPQDIEVLIN